MAIIDPLEQGNIIDPMEQHSQQRTIADMLGGGNILNFLGGMAEMSPLGMARSGYEGARHQEPLGAPVTGLMGSLRDISQQKALGEEMLGRLPAAPEFGSGGAYTAGEVVGALPAIAGGVGALYGLGKVGIKGIKTASKLLSPTAHAGQILEDVTGMKQGLEKVLGKETGNVLNEVSGLKQGLEKSTQGEFNSILKDLGGDKTHLENAKEFGEKIAKSADEQKKIGAKMYEDAIGQHKNVNLYEQEAKQLKPKAGMSVAEYKQYISAAERLGKTGAAEIEGGIPDFLRNKTGLPLDAQTQYSKFLKSPTVDNAHRLQSQLGYEVRDLIAKDKRNPLNVTDTEYLKKLIKFRDEVQQEFNLKLNKIDPSGNLSKGFEKAVDFWAENVIPYRQSAALSQIAGRRITNPKKIAAEIPSILKSNHIEKVAEHIGEPFGKHILSHDISKIKNLNEDKLIDYLGNLEQKGLDIYKPQGLEESLGRLKSSHEQRGLIEQLHDSINKVKSEPLKLIDKLVKHGDIGQIPGLNLERIDLLQKTSKQLEPVQKLHAQMSSARKASKSLEAIERVAQEHPDIYEQIPGLGKAYDQLNRKLVGRKAAAWGTGAALGSLGLGGTIFKPVKQLFSE